MFTFDGPNKLIILDSGLTEFTAKDMYSSWKVWTQQGDNAKYLPAFRTSGGDPLGEGRGAGDYYFLQNQIGWKIRPQEANHVLTVGGNLFGENSAVDIFIPPIGDYRVTIKVLSSALTQTLVTSAKKVINIWED